MYIHRAALMHAEVLLESSRNYLLCIAVSSQVGVISLSTFSELQWSSYVLKWEPFFTLEMVDRFVIIYGDFNAKMFHH